MTPASGPSEADAATDPGERLRLSRLLRRPVADRTGELLGRLADVIVRVSDLIAELPEITEIDLNPVLARPDASLAVDVRVRVRPAPEPVLLDHVRHLR